MMGAERVADVVVVGYGAAGVCAALEARSRGADVVALDRANGGGAAALSGGIIYAGAGTAVQAEAGVDDCAERMLSYLRLEVGDAVRPETLERFVRTSPEMIDWLSGHGVPFDATLCPYKTSFPNNRYYLYHSGSENAGAFRSTTPPVQRGHRVKGKGTSGKMLYRPLADSAQTLGVDLRPHTSVNALSRDAGGRVIGVEATTMAGAPKHVRRSYAALTALSAKPGVYHPPTRGVVEDRLRRLRHRFGRPLCVEARYGVIVCAGGFIANRDLVARYAPEFLGGLPLGTSGDDGSGIALALDAGAVTARMDNISVWRFITPPSAFISAIIVDDQGGRIIDESRYGAALGRAMVKDHRAKAFLLADAALMGQAKRQLLTQTLWFQRAQAAALMTTDAVRGRTLREVAHACGIDADGLEATVVAHNDAVRDGTPDPAGKPAEFRRSISKPPFTLLNISVRPRLINPTPMLTLGGVRVAEDTGAVVTALGEPIAGLYAAGRTAVGVCSNSYVSGLSLADCIFSGRRAGAAVVDTHR
jgi:3-oxo-5alpha-steroid 4-dehydrogenase